METLKVGIREFREKLASYLLESDKPLAITRHGDTVGYYLPARRKRSEAERSALRQAAAKLQGMSQGVDAVAAVAAEVQGATAALTTRLLDIQDQSLEGRALRPTETHRTLLAHGQPHPILSPPGCLV